MRPNDSRAHQQPRNGAPNHQEQQEVTSSLRSMNFSNANNAFQPSRPRSLLTRPGPYLGANDPSLRPAYHSPAQSASHSLLQPASLMPAYVPPPFVRQQNVPNFQHVFSFSKEAKTHSMRNAYETFGSFIQNPKKQILFVFGPSGSGKHLLINKGIQRIESPFQEKMQIQRVEPLVTEDEYEETVVEDPIDMVQRVLKLQTSRIQNATIYVFEDFPIHSSGQGDHWNKKMRLFRKRVKKLFEDCWGFHKFIFILNSSIYSSYEILSESSKDQNIAELPSVSVLTLQNYGIRDMTKILNCFIEKYPIYAASKDTLDDIITLANGDARAGLNQLYLYKSRQVAKQQLEKKNYEGTRNREPERVRLQPQRVQASQVQQQKVNIYHTLGKFLYGKRKNIDFDPNKKESKNNEYSRCYTEQQLQKYDPGFYFKQVETLNVSKIPDKVFYDLLQENYLDHYGRVRDVKDIGNIFRAYDTCLEASTFEVVRDLKKTIRELIAIGIIVYNRNSVKARRLMQIKRSRSNLVQCTIERKLQLIKAYFTRLGPRQYQAYGPTRCRLQREWNNYTGPTGRTRYRDVIAYAHLLRTRDLKNDQFFQKKLVQIVFEPKGYANSTYIQGEMVIQEEDQEELGIESCKRLEKIGEELAAEITRREKKKEQMLALLDSDSDYSDIDSDVE